MATIVRSLHVALLVRDLETAKEFYRDVLGLELVPRSLKFPGLWFQVGDFQIHIMQFDDWQAPCPRPDKWGRNPHLAFQVDDLGPIKARLSERGHPIQMSSSGRAALFTQDSDGNIVELSQG
ncbi:VOC family protein [Oscillatoria sp. CS-180]|uniref:VOC family protein n=1 Tax=Oscillatoria sp. CS-180 TaxID=3021720 RepID=UPI00232BD28B|nr:VOC family protein [Oscillatoria sp. CS-180]MDB9527485.1 VOC family protein [Oscillatoria sp. CS-180]